MAYLIWVGIIVPITLGWWGFKITEKNHGDYK